MKKIISNITNIMGVAGFLCGFLALGATEIEGMLIMFGIGFILCLPTIILVNFTTDR